MKHKNTASPLSASHEEKVHTPAHSASQVVHVGRPPLLVMTLSALLLAVTGAGIYGAWYYQNKMASVSQASLAASQSPQERATALSQEIATLVAVPTDETPTVADVADVSKLANQPFFEQAKNGDVVFIYQKSKRAILYRPSEKKIVEATSVALSEPTPTEVVSSPGTKKPTPKLTPTKSVKPSANPSEQSLGE